MNTQHAKRLTSQAISLILLACLPVFVYAELEMLDDKALEEQSAQAGITIDLSFKLSIGEILFNYSDQTRHASKQKTELPQPAPRIEYVHNDN